MVSQQNNFNSGSPASCGCWPIIVVTTDEYDRAVASTMIGENRNGSRVGASRAVLTAV
jgi:hypothetical protein